MSFEDFEFSYGVFIVIQHCLKSFSLDKNNSLNDRISAFIIYGWIGSMDMDLIELPNLWYWDSKFISKSLTTSKVNIHKV